MEWSKDFYDTQFEWLHANKEYNTERLLDSLVEKVDKYSEYPVKKILELGGGSGQFAVAAAKKGYEVTVIELAPSAVGHMKELAQKNNVSERLSIVHGDFYEVTLHEAFDVICYWDGFGIGSDRHQQVLLERVTNWLNPNGIALIDVYTPWYWSKVTGQKMKFGNYNSHYDFDAYESRMINTCWIDENKDKKIIQSLRCYSPTDLKLLTLDMDLKLVYCEPSGEMDYENWHYNADVPLERAMTFLAKFEKGK
ncbi:SAM-dependent methyltransferase [Oceanobacillus bengalensis]|uniref:Class I SAM-dependent methyltransferase n=1 Tax=Oceanobacillus bengalensis TaxID=1435466 RepID=A0A494Z3U8_9BACI|nr:class I SAM-dependent methyltransferase [Oceanobacillus bengalensis]RKQ17136.1 class I SAM-dependent methyltransferase [Oceanobacillus bengalensis]